MVNDAGLFARRYWLYFALVAFAFPLCASQPTGNAATVPNNTDSSSATRGKPEIPEKLDSDSEATVNRLVETHLPELKPLLQRLKKSEPAEYRKAVRDLARSARKLELAKGRSEQAFDVEVELLQAQTKVNLFAARLRIRDNPRDRKQLRTAVDRLQSAQLERAKLDVAALRDRLAKTQKQLELATQRLETKQKSLDEQTDKMYANLIRRAGLGKEAERDRKTNRTESNRRPSGETKKDERIEKK